MSSTTTKRKVSGKAAAGVAKDCPSAPDAGNRLECIAACAYYKAETRGFVPGRELDDWLEAETEYDTVSASRS